MRNLSTWILGLSFGLQTLSHAEILKNYHCLSGETYQNHLLDANLHLEAYKDAYLTTMTWNNQQVGHGRLHRTQKPNLFIEQWTNTGKTNRHLGISRWRFEDKTINILYHAVDENTGRFYQGEINCRPN